MNQPNVSSTALRQPSVLLLSNGKDSAYASGHDGIANDNSHRLSGADGENSNELARPSDAGPAAPTNRSHQAIGAQKRLMCAREKANTKKRGHQTPPATKNGPRQASRPLNLQLSLKLLTGCQATDKSELVRPLHIASPVGLLLAASQPIVGRGAQKDEMD